MYNRIKRGAVSVSISVKQLVSQEARSMSCRIRTNAKYPWRLYHRGCSRSSDLFQLSTPSQSSDQWQVVATFCWNLQQRVLSRIFTGFPFNPFSSLKLRGTTTVQK